MKRNRTPRAWLSALLLCALLAAFPVMAQGEAEVSIDFANGNIEFLALYAAPVDASPDTTMELVEFGDGMAVKIVPDADNAPYVVIDASSLLGDRIADLAAMHVLIATEHADGNFYAVSGELISYSGEDRAETKGPWSVYIGTRNPNTARVTLTEATRMVPDAHNFFILNKKDDNGLKAGAGPVTLYILSITFFDDDGNVLPADADAVFNPPEGWGESGASSLYALLGETVLEGASGSTNGGWGQAVAMDAAKNGGPFDAAIVTPGTVFTVAYDSGNAPELIFQSWTEGAPDGSGWAKVAPRIVEGGAAQFFYDDIIAAFGGDDLESFVDKFYVGDTGAALTVMRVSYGEGVPPPFTVKDEAVIEGASGSSNGGWGQAVAMDAAKNGGPFDAAIVAPGSVITVLYESDTRPALIFQSWTEGAPDGSGWAQVFPFALGKGVAQFAYDDIVATFGGEDLESYLDKFYVGDTGAALNVMRVTVGMPLPRLATTVDEIVIEGASGSTNGGWGQAVAMDTGKGGGRFDADWVFPGTVITVLYESASMPEVIFQSWSGGPEGWAKVAPYTWADGIVQFDYDGIVAAFGTDDFEAFFDKFYVGDTGEALTVMRVIVGNTLEPMPVAEEADEDGEEAGEEAEEVEVEPLPPPVAVADEFEIEGSEGSSGGGWGQAVVIDAVKNGGIFDPAWFVPGTVITVTYESEREPEIIWQSWTDGNPVGWAKVAPFAAGDGVAQFAYDDIVASFGTDDFETFLDRFNVGDTGESLTVFKVTVGMAE